MHSPLLFSLALLLPGPARVQDDQVSEACQAIRASELRSRVAYLSSDSLRGRDTPSPGLDTAAAYLASQFEAAGLEPVHDQGFLVPHVLECLAPRLDGARLELDGATDAVALEGGDRLLLLAGFDREAREREIEEVVRAERLEDLFRGAARAGSLAVVPWDPDAILPGPPGGPRGLRLTPDLLAMIAAQMNLAAVVLLCPGEEENWAALQDAATRTRIDSGRPGRPVLAVRADDWPDRVTSVVLQLAPAPAVSATAYNVVARCPGRDPALREQHLIVTAHYDHIGVLAAGSGDRVFNGADDNATGTAAVVELAESFAMLEEGPRRSVLFACFFGEEKGLLGSRAYVARPPVPLEQTVANVNLEMLGRPPDDGRGQAWIVGYDYSDLPARMTEAAADVEVPIVRHPKYDETMFHRSDNLSFAEHGIPAHTVSASAIHEDYHGVDDELDRLDFPHMERVVRALFLGLLELADQDAAPRWNEDQPAAARFAGRRGGS